MASYSQLTRFIVSKCFKFGMLVPIYQKREYTIGPLYQHGEGYRSDSLPLTLIPNPDSRTPVFSAFPAH